MKKVLIFGANSLLTAHLLKQHSEDHVSIVYHSQPSRLTDKNHPLSDFKKIDQNQDVVYILSALISNDPEQLDNILNINILLIKNITEHFANSKIVYFSSVAIYDGIHSGTINNGTTPSPSSLYGLSKLFAEKIVEKCSKYAILRISSIYGLSMKENTFLPKIVISAIENNKIELLGKGDRKQNYIHAEDVARLAKKLSLENKNKIILAISPDNYTNLEIADFIKELTGCEITFHGKDFSRSIEYFENDLSVSSHAFIPIKQGLKELIEWKRK
ncbi:NAD(P)-dependent oxidoreductase [Chryseobacterium sp. MHB01]|uniref:SDR family oxidoreductase n=1 Tax=Chryseobacterium sp. MHB01 TaxID=3109433 RepID=UPI002AFDCAE8|nr:NAD(P)-dependent oxidoreductase [Chryseobacterium sp. MHB01]MEA1849624.1 NAD(P)-dependent oxidoreductase [Chryseobacterium sp. MHB01]